MAPPRVIVLNGGSSSGKTTLARALQAVLAGDWLRFGVDTLLDAAPPALLGGDGITFGDDGAVGVGGRFRAVEDAWMAGLAAMAAAGASLIVEDDFVSGPATQQRWAHALRGVTVGWVGVRCAATVAERRERQRGDRVDGMAAAQADLVHRGIGYGLEVDTSDTAPDVLARAIQQHFGLPAAAE